jgi:mannan polymerase II complex ANP1 subunit
MEEMERERKERERQEKEKAERVKKLKEEFKDTDTQWVKDKAAVAEKARQDEQEQQAKAAGPVSSQGKEEAEAAD